MARPPVLVSACLLGTPCRYDGGSRPSPELMEILREETLLPVCPEMLAGFGSPRPSMDYSLRGRRRILLSCHGEDLTRRIDRACNRILQWATETGVLLAVCKERSPSCGSTQVTQDGIRVNGQGWMVRKLLRREVKVFSEEQLEQLREALVTSVDT